ncbi:MAG: patatin family protein [Lentisphaeria bacterium]|nr:patatin family protein [Lentisphaeria bacterium]
MDKTGLVLEGGAMRGLFSAGILDVLLDEHISFDGMIGVSAGAAFGCNFKSGQAGRALRYNLRFCRDVRYCSWRSWFRTGDLFGADFCYHELPDKLDLFDCAAFKANPMEFYLVCTDVRTGQAVYHRCPEADEESFEWMRASASMPLVSRMVEIGGGKYLDGALADSIPLRFFESLGYRKNVVILTQPAGFLKRPSCAMALLRLVYRKYPELLRVMEQRHEIYNETVRYVESCAGSGSVLLLRPENPLGVKRICHDPEQLLAAYEAGRSLARKRLPEIRAFAS